jgi:SAM-dependent methyltransferase
VVVTEGTCDWEWDESLYAGSAAFYPSGRMPYPPGVADALRAELSLDGSGRLLDVGCGPGSLTLVVADLFEEVLGIDADHDMIETARQQAARAGVRNARWQVMKAEDLSEALGTFRAVAFAQSFHWLDRLSVAGRARALLEREGACILVHATTHEGVISERLLAHPRPPRDEIADLVKRYLGPVRRAGRGSLPSGTPSGEDAVMEEAGFADRTRVEVSGGDVSERGEDDIVASIFSLSSSAPHLFGAELGNFESDLRSLLRRTSPTGYFSEERGAIALDVWRQ